MEKKLWYRTPGETFSDALPFGNGSLGGMFYGQMPSGSITLNLDTLWSGTGTKTEKEIPEDVLLQSRKLIFAGKYQEADELVKEKMLGFFNESYLPMAIFSYRFLNIPQRVDKYRRDLDLQDGMLSMDYESGDCNIRSEIFASYPEQAIVIRYESLDKNDLNIDFHLSSLLKYEILHDNEGIHLEGTAPSHVEPNYVECAESVFYDKTVEGMYFCTKLSVHSTDGNIEISDKTLKVRDAARIVLLITAADGYKGYKQPLCKRRSQLYEECAQCADGGRGFSYQELRNRHLEDYKGLFGRVAFELETEGEGTEIATDERIKLLKQGAEDLDFYTLFFQFGRYLMIASSREGSQPSNLQGIWNEEIRPAWSSNYTININTQMNYWMVCGANLSECQEPLNHMLEEISDKGKETALKQCHCRGWAANHNIDLWRHTNPVAGLPKYAYWPFGGVWLASHLYIYYRHTLDKAFLKETAYPILKGCTEFCLDWLTEGTDGKWHTCPSTTPENVFADKEGKTCSVSYSTTLDITLIKELFYSFIKISEEIEVEKELLARVQKVLPNLPMFSVGPDGCLQEWAEPFQEIEAGHRHMSPVYGIYPGNLINEYDCPELLEAGRKFIDRRIGHGGGHIGWSCAWLICLQARLQDGDKAYSYLKRMAQHSIYHNLLDLHPPLGENFEGEKEVFQIDGNFGTVEGIINMLLQSHLDEIHLLPALPAAWKEGCVRGLCACGGFEVSIQWKNGILKRAWIQSSCGEKMVVRYNRPFAITDKNDIILSESDRGNHAVCDTVERGEYIVVPV